MRRFALIFLLTFNAVAQQPATLERGIYAENTEGNLDQAIAIYRAVVKSQQLRPILAQAQQHLVIALLKKGELAQGMSELTVLRRDFGDFPALVQEAQQHLVISKPKPLGEVVGGVYHHFKTGVEIPLPFGWTTDGDSPSSDGGEMVELKDSGSNSTRLSVWMIQEKNSPDDVENALSTAIGEKIRMRRDMYGDNDEYYKVRFKDVQKPTISGQRGLIYIADYKRANKVGVEYFAYVVSENTRVLFIATAAPDDMPLVQSRLEKVVFASKIP